MTSRGRQVRRLERLRTHEDRVRLLTRSVITIGEKLAERPRREHELTAEIHIIGSVEVNLSP